MPNPGVLLCDADALIQLFLATKQTRSLIPLRSLRDDYGIQPAIVAEVEVELLSNRKYGAKVMQELRRALGNGTLEILDVGAMSKYVSSSVAKGVFGVYQTLGQQYAKVADLGEAYTLAAAVTLDVPALSNDITALRALDRHNHAVPSPVLRSFDLLALSLQTGTLAEKDCDDARKELRGRGEHVPAPFQNASFGDGMKWFCPRILDDEKPGIGMAPQPGPGYTAQIRIRKKS
jgi:hypothetical protein